MSKYLVTGLVSLTLLYADSLLEQPKDVELQTRNSTAERKIDKELLQLLGNYSQLVVVGKIQQYDVANKYGMALTERFPMQVSVEGILKGELDGENKVLNVGVTRDETEFRYAKERSYIFFLKSASQAEVALSESKDWRVISDYFGVQEYSLSMERMFKQVP